MVVQIMIPWGQGGAIKWGGGEFLNSRVGPHCGLNLYEGEKSFKATKAAECLTNERKKMGRLFQIMWSRI